MRKIPLRRTPIDDNTDSCERTCVTLLIYPDELTPGEVTDRLGLNPTRFVEKGVVQRNRLGRSRTGKVNGWFLGSEGHVQSNDMRRHLEWLLDKIEPVAAQLALLQNTDGVEMRVDCIWWAGKGAGGPVLWPEHMGRLAALNLELTFSVAFYGDEDEEVPTGRVNGTGQNGSGGLLS